MRLTTLESSLVGLLLLIPLLLTGGVLKENQRRDREQSYAAANQDEDAMPPLHGAIAPDEHQHKRSKVEQREDEKAEIDRRVADATDELATYTKGLFWATGLLAFGTAILVIYAVKQSRDAVRSSEAAAQAAGAAERSAECARDALVQGQRAWLIVDAEIGNTGISFDPLRMSIPINLKYRNIGNAIALSITPYAKVFPGGKYGPSIVEWQDFIRDATSRPGYCSIYLIPGESLPSQDDPSGLTVLLDALKYRDLWFEDAMKQNEVKLFVGGCVTYTFPTDRGAVHHTGFFIHVNRRDGKPLSPMQKEIPASDLVFGRDLGSNFFSID